MTESLYEETPNIDNKPLNGQKISINPIIEHHILLFEDNIILPTLLSPVAFVSGVEVGTAAAVEVALQLVPVGRRGGVLAVLDELVGHSRRGDRPAVRHGRAQLQRSEDGSELCQR